MRGRQDCSVNLAARSSEELGMDTFQGGQKQLRKRTAWFLSPGAEGSASAACGGSASFFGKTTFRVKKINNFLSH